MNRTITSPLDKSAQGTRPWRAWLVLGRLSNLPTVWSNALAGLVLGAGSFPTLGLWLGSAMTLSCLYVAGMFLNDVVDANFDREHRPERPIPAGQVSRTQVMVAALSLLLVGMLLGTALALSQTAQPVLGIGLLLLLTAVIIAYDLLHKRHASSVVLMGLCRAVSILYAASLVDGLHAGTVWACAAVALLYTLALTAAARNEHVEDARVPNWPWLLILSPLLIAPVVSGGWLVPMLVVSALFAFAQLQAWRLLHQAGPGAAVPALIAALALIDALWVSLVEPRWIGLPVAAWWLTRLAQRSLPAS